MDLALLAVASGLYAVLLCYGYLRDLDEYTVTRPIVVAGGVLLVISVGTWGDWAAFNRWFLLFGAAGIPMLLRSAFLFVIEQRTKRLSQHDPGATHADGAAVADPRR